jgi:hypothetical protein
MSQKFLNNKKPKIKVAGSMKRRNQPTKQNLNKPNVTNRQIHKNSARIGKMIETEMASQVSGASGVASGMLNLIKVDKQILGRINAKKGGKKKNKSGSALV